MDLRRLRTLDAIVRHRSFTRAAEELHIAQPAVSQQLKSLESELGLELVDRTTRTPTEPGRILLNRSRVAIAELEAATAEIADLVGLRSGIVRAGAIHWLEPLDLVDLLGSFAEHYPGISIELREENAVTMFDMLEQAQLDLVLSNISPGDPVRSGLERRVLFTEDLVLGVNPEHPFSRRGSIRLEELREESFVAFRSGSAFRDTVFGALREAGVLPHVAFESSDLVTVRNLAARGLGIALMPRSLATAPGLQLSVIEIAPRPPTRTVALTWRASHPPSPPARAFLNFTHAWLDDRLGASDDRRRPVVRVQ